MSVSTSHRSGSGRPASGLLAALALTVILASGACGPSAGTPSEAPGAVSEPAAGTVEAERIDVPSAAGATAPELALLETPDGPEAALTWLEPRPVGPAEPSGSAGSDRDERSWRLRFARLGPSGWSQPVTIVTGGPGASDGDGLAGEDAPLFVNWADRPGAVQAAGGEPDADTETGRLFVHWLAMNGESVYAYEVRMARSDDGGRSWSPLGRVHEDDQAAEHGFVSYVADPRASPSGGGVRAVWLDGRATTRGEPMTLRTALVGDAVDRASEELLDDSVCDCCSTTAVATATGPLIVYRGRTADEVRDHWMVRGTADGAGGWSAPEPLHRDGWTIPACPVNGPVAGGLPGGDTVWVAWFTAADGEPRVLAAVSTDGGATFGDPVEIDGPATGAPLGRLDLVVERSGTESGGGTAVVSWLDREDSEAVIRLRRLSATGRLGPAVDVARSSTSRASGVPRLLALPEPTGTRLLVAWVDPGDSDRDDAPRTLRLVRFAAAGVPGPSD